MDVGSETVREIDELGEKEALKKLEAIMFVSGRFLNMKDFVSLSDLNPIMIRETLEKLKDNYDNEETAIMIVHKGEGGESMWKMDVKPDYMYVVNRIATGNSEFSKAEQETLAIIAFKQPIKQSVLIKIRGNKAYDHIKKFKELGMIKKKKEGHTYELSLSDDFYDYFNVIESEMKKSEE
ncbi:MAG TPA: SMC-Scp complex subunit ScpB [Candidatus Pacearchaeota archaeon]|nr:SMC-Scp complex subunit ScpB [Candidatus Pacearchaeota archaeon]